MNWAGEAAGPTLKVLLLDTTADPAPAFKSATLASSGAKVSFTKAAGSVTFTLPAPPVADAIVLR